MSAFSETEYFDAGRLCAFIGCLLAAFALGLMIWRDARAANSWVEARFVVLSSVVLYGGAFALVVWFDIGLPWLALAVWIFFRWQTRRRRDIDSTQHGHWLYR
jgi:hypothetical protein